MRPDGSAWRHLVRVAGFLLFLALPTTTHARFDQCQVDEDDLQWVIYVIEESVCTPEDSCLGGHAHQIGYTVGQLKEATAARGPEVKDCMLLIDTGFQQLVREIGASTDYKTGLAAGTASEEPLSDNLVLLLDELERLALAAVGRTAEGEEGTEEKKKQEEQAEQEAQEEAKGSDVVDAKALIGAWELIDDVNGTGTIWLLDFAADGSFVTSYSLQTWDGTWELQDSILFLRFPNRTVDWVFAFEDSARSRFKLSFEEEWYLFQRRE